MTIPMWWYWAVVAVTCAQSAALLVYMVNASQLRRRCAFLDAEVQERRRAALEARKLIPTPTMVDGLDAMGNPTGGVVFARNRPEDGAEMLDRLRARGYYHAN